MRYDLTDEQYDRLLKASQPVAMIALQCGNPSSPRENAEREWKRIADEVGCNYATIEPYPGAAKSFTAEPAALTNEVKP